MVRSVEPAEAVFHDSATVAMRPLKKNGVASKAAMRASVRARSRTCCATVPPYSCGTLYFEVGRPRKSKRPPTMSVANPWRWASATSVGPSLTSARYCANGTSLR